MPQTLQNLIDQYVSEIRKICGAYLKQVILYGSYARGDYKEDSDVDIMVLLDLPETEIKKYQHQISDMTFDFNLDHDLDIKPIEKNEKHFLKWVKNYPFYANVYNEGVTLYLKQIDAEGENVL